MWPVTTAESLAIPARRVTGRRAETRRRLVAAAYDIFTELGIRDATVEVICERAGFTRGAFYSNFVSKEDLFLAVYREQMQIRLDRLKAAADTIVGSVDPAASDAVENSLRCVAKLTQDWLVSDEAWFLLAIEFRVHVVRQPELREAAASVFAGFYDDLGGTLEGILDRFGVELTIGTRDAALVLASVYETVLVRTLLERPSGVADDPSMLELIPRLLSAMIVIRR